MRTIKKTIIISALVLTTAAGTWYFATNPAFAQDIQAPEASLVQKIADKFGLNKSDVQAVFDQEKTDRQADIQAKFGAKLDQAVKDGKLTDAQKQTILNKFKELQANRKANLDKLKSMTPDQRRAAMQTEKQDLQNWAQQNGIDLKSLLGEMGFGMRGHFIRGH